MNLKKLIIIFFIFLTACSKTIEVENVLTPPVDNVSINNAKTIAVLPFKNLTEKPELSKLVRISFYSHLTVRAFRDIELTTIDNALKKLKVNYISINNKNLISKLSEMLNADYLVFGKVIANKKVFAAIYSLNSIEVEINIVDSHTYKIVWNDTIISKQHEGGVPTSILSVPFISVSTGSNMDKDITFILIEDACRLLAYRIPSKLISYQTTKNRYYLQAGAFLSKPKSIQVLNKLRERGFPCFLKKENKWYKVLLGPYESQEEARLQQNRLIKILNIQPIIKTDN